MAVTTRPVFAALTGALFLVPFLATNAIIGDRIEPFFSLIRPGPHTSAREYAILLMVLLLIPVGAAIAARPMLGMGADGQRRFHPVNAVVAAVLCLAFVSLCVGLGSDIYRCDILDVPNCD